MNAMLKSPVCLFALLLGIAASTAIHAQATPSCQLWISDTNITYADATKDALQKSLQHPSMLSFGKRTAMLSVVCDQASHVALMFQGAPSDDGAFRFGRNGRARIRLDQAQWDGRPVQLTRAVGVAKAQGGGNAIAVRPGDSIAPWAPGVQEGKQLTMQVTVEPLVPANATHAGAQEVFQSDIMIKLIANGAEQPMALSPCGMPHGPAHAAQPAVLPRGGGLPAGEHLCVGGPGPVLPQPSTPSHSGPGPAMPQASPVHTGPGPAMPQASPVHTGPGPTIPQG